MIVFFGTRLYGKVMRCRESFVATRFAHIFFLPLFPLQSFVVLRSLGDNGVRAIPTPLHLGSIGLAYLRGWSVFLLLHGVLNWVASDTSNGEWYGPAVTAVAAIGLLLGFLVLGRTRDPQRSRLEAYARVFGEPVDLALLGDARASIAQHARAGLAAIGQQHAINYRVSYDPVLDWQRLALDPSMREPAYLTNALALARIEWSAASGASKADLGRLHDQIWDRIIELERGAPRTLNASQL